MKLEMVQFLLVLVSALHLYGQKKSILVFDSHSRTSQGVRIANSQSVLLEFCSIKALNLFIMKYYEKIYESTSTLQYNIQYINVKTSEIAA